MRFFSELRRGNVMRIGVFYCVSAWLLLQIADLIFELLLVPAWTLRFIFGALAAAFPFLLFGAWAFELTPEGIRREADLDHSTPAASDTKRKLNLLTSVLAAAAIGIVVADHFLLQGEPASPKRF